MPILISRVGKMSIESLQDFQILNVTFNNTSTAYDFSFLKQLERTSFSIYGDCTNTLIHLFIGFKDSLYVLELFNCLDILQMVQSVNLSNLKFLLLEHCNLEDMKSMDEKVDECFKAINEMNLPNLLSISMRTIPIASLKDLKRLTNYKSAMKELAWVFEGFEEKISSFNDQLNSLSEWLPNLKCLILRMIGNGVEGIDFSLDNIKLDVEAFYYYARYYACSLYLRNLDAPNLENLEIVINSPMTFSPFDLTKFPRLKRFNFYGWPEKEEEMKLDNKNLEECELDTIRKLNIVGKLPALKKLLCDEAIEEIFEENNIHVSNWKEPSRSITSSKQKREMEQEIDKCTGSFFAKDRHLFQYYNKF